MPFSCLLRGISLKESPEERVRQQLIAHMLGPLKYPKYTLIAEKKLRELVPGQILPNRRLDLVCMSLIEGQLKPLILIECKAGPLSEAAFFQLLGYNYYIQAPFIALANPIEQRTGWVSEGQFHWKEGIPSYNNIFKLNF